MKSQCILFEQDVAEPRLGSFELSDLREGEILTRTLYTAVSPGTELRCLADRQAGTPTDRPYVAGYANVGTVIDANGCDFNEGDLVYTGGTLRTSDTVGKNWGGHSEYVIADSQAIKLPSTLSPLAASLSTLGGIAYHGFKLAKAQVDEPVVVVGLGILGQLSARIHQASGANVLGCDVVDSRVAISNASGLPAVSSKEGISPAIRRVMPDGCSLLVDTTGVQQVIAPAIEAIKDLPWDARCDLSLRYLVQGSYPVEFTIPHRSAFFRELTFLLARDRFHSDVCEFIELLTTESIKVEDLIHQVYDPQDCAAAYAALKDPESVPGTVAFKWS